MSGYTPGPWVVKTLSEQVAHPCNAVITNAPVNAKEFDVLALLHMHTSCDRANARLIAAAPDLLAALKVLGYCSAAYVEGHPAFAEALRAAQDAITKAEGK